MTKGLDPRVKPEGDIKEGHEDDEGKRARG